MWYRNWGHVIATGR